MKHLGDITKIHGDRIPPVSVITAGSPCQDLSIAGKRAGLEGERSGLFMDSIRIVREMRNKTHGEYPRYFVWENVPGAFSSNGGRDFAAVLEEIIRVVDSGANVDVPGRGWPKFGAYADAGRNFSLAWRLMDAQFWGVPQRRRRISLVADFGGDSAGQILFVERGLPWNPAESGETGKGTAGDAENSSDDEERIVSYTLNSTDRHAVCIGNGQAHIAAHITEEISQTLNCMHDPMAIMVGNAIGTRPYQDRGESANLVADVGSDLKTVRRLTPTECCRLQGYPDGWCDIGEWVDSKGKRRKESDAAKYKAFGNSIALPQWRFVLGGISEFLPDDAKMGSLFDGIGGFPLVWSNLHGGSKRLCAWASEIEEFPIAVTKYHFPEDE